MPATTAPSDALAPFTIFVTFPVYDNRDAIVGNRTVVECEYRYETFGCARAVAGRREAADGEIFLTVRDARGREVREPLPAPAPMLISCGNCSDDDCKGCICF